MKRQMVILKNQINEKMKPEKHLIPIKTAKTLRCDDTPLAKTNTQKFTTDK